MQLIPSKFGKSRSGTRGGHSDAFLATRLHHHPPHTTKMPGKVKDVQQKKRVLVDAPSSRQNVQTESPSKRRKLNGQPKNFKTPNGPGSSQVKSQFEEEVLEKLTQDIDDLKQKNSERDQQWTRPGLDDFDEKTDSLCFQQIEAEEGTLHGGKTVVKLFGVSQVSNLATSWLVEC